MKEIWCNGEWLAADRYPGAAQDRGAVFGLGLFETLGASDGRPVFSDRHLSRIIESCARLGWLFAFPDFRETIIALLARNGLGNGRARVRLIVTSGSGAHDDLAAGADRLIWLAAFPAADPPECLRMCLSPWPRNERSPLAGLKSACYAENLIALDHARRRGFQEAVFFNTVDKVCETASANLFIVKNGTVRTPSLASGCLPGVGRDVILDLCYSHGLRVEEADLEAGDLESADEIFLSSATRGPVPVSGFEERELAIGPVTRELRGLWDLEVDR